MTDRFRLPASRRTSALVAGGACLLLVAGGTTAYATGSKTVELAVDGDIRPVDLRGDTVGDVLAAAGLDAGEHDQLTPAADTPIADGALVSLRRGRELNLVVDGQPRTVWVTAASVDEALQQVGLRTEGAALSASRSRQIGLSGMSLDVRLPKAVTVRADGKDVPLTTTGLTVADALAEAAVAVRPQDRVSVPLAQPLTDQLLVQVVRVDDESVVSTEAVPYATVRRDDPAALVGSAQVVQQGRAGVLTRTTVVHRVDGAETGRDVTGEVRTTQPVDRVVAVGTRPRPAPAPAPAPVPRAAAAPRAAAPAPAPAPAPAATGAGSGLNWAALAACESGGDPRAVSSTGKYMGLYQFDLGTWASVGGSGRPSDASAAEQTSRAQRLYAGAGRSPWPVCGKRL